MIIMVSVFRLLVRSDRRLQGLTIVGIMGYNIL
jgi:hypothetical protein